MDSEQLTLHVQDRFSSSRHRPSNPMLFVFVFVPMTFFSIWVLLTSESHVTGIFSVSNLNQLSDSLSASFTSSLSSSSSSYPNTSKTSHNSPDGITSSLNYDSNALSVPVPTPALRYIPLVIGYCDSDWARYTVQEIARNFPPPFNASAIPSPNHHVNISIRSPWGNCRFTATHSIWVDMENRKYQQQKPLIFTTVSPPDHTVDDYHGTIYIPYAFFSMPERQCCQVSDLVRTFVPQKQDSSTDSFVTERVKGKNINVFNLQMELKRKQYFCAFTARWCAYNKDQDMLRTKFFDILSKNYKQVHALSNCRHNHHPPPIKEDKFNNDRDTVAYWFRPYKFAIVFENTIGHGYFTEKIFNAYFARTIPIYWGSPKIAQLINMDAIVWCDPEQDMSFSKCIEIVKELDENDDLYLEKLAQPIFKDNQIPQWMTWQPYIQRVINELKLFNSSDTQHANS